MVNLVSVASLGKEHTIFIPSIQPYVSRLCAAVLRGAGFGSEVLEETEKTLDLGMKHTSGGECLPCPSTLGAMIATVEERDLDPARTVFFMPTTCGPCRFGQYATFSGLTFRRKGWDQLKIIGLNSENSYAGFSTQTRKFLWHAFVIGDVLQKLLLKYRPYETKKGGIEALLRRWLERFEASLENRSADLEALMEGVVEEAASVPLHRRRRPLVAVVGEIYVRSDPFLNKNLFLDIERLGGEALATTLSEWVLYCSHLERQNIRRSTIVRRMRRNPLQLFVEKKWFHHVESKYMKLADPLLHDRHEPSIEEIVSEGRRYITQRFQSETILTVGRAVLFIKRDNVQAVVNASPMFCMPGTISAAIFSRIEQEYGVPCVSTFYDGYGNPNRSLVPYLHFLTEAERASGGRK